MLDNDQNKMDDIMKKSFYYRNKFKLDAFQNQKTTENVCSKNRILN